MAITLTQQDIKSLLADPNLSAEEKARLQQSMPQTGLLSSVGQGARGILGVAGAALKPFAESIAARTPQMMKDIQDTQRFYELERMKQPTIVPISQMGQLRQITPAGIAAGLDQYRAAEQAAIQKPLIDAAAAEAGLLNARSKTGGLFGGTSMTAQSMNIIRALAPKIKAGTATPQEIQDYKLAEAGLSRRRVQESTDPETGVTTRTDIPGIDLLLLDFPTFQESVSLGETAPKYTEGQLEAGKFGNVMWNAERELGLISGEGYDATDFGDRIASLTPNTFRSYLTTPEGQRYQRAKQSFLLATLRDESGAAIATKEYKDKEFALFPLPGDSPELVRNKAKARQAELNGIVKSSGKFYERNFKGQTIENLFKPGVGTNFNLSVYGTKGQRSNPIMVNSEAEGDALPPGTFYVVPDGQLGRAE